MAPSGIPLRTLRLVASPTRWQPDRYRYQLLSALPLV
jgi:hypothetical protein